ncbi:porin [Mucilaginibacter sp. HMF5004]|uniref:porin n=1 Tax=Mucilaginibacter rivuli TaxID=2857527 RepID=UPI001C5FDD50|nr:porin [Mucilaginibacter rivuli]MBW4890790.1 porin [Mucilaginibacter rivuli]
MKQKFLLICALAVSGLAAKAQDAKPAESPLVISGSVDTYFKYDFAGKKAANIQTSFANESNSVSLGMIDLGLKKKVGKASFVGELSFGPRGQSQSIPDVAGSSYHIQNLYVSYDLTDKLNVTGGYMGTFVGYEVISPVGNFNYSTSYLFTNGPFQNAGLKFTYTFSDKASLMAGIFNDAWNNYSSTNDLSTFGAQLMIAPVKGWTAYLNVAAGYYSGLELDLTTNYQITDAFKLGLNVADFSQPSYKFAPNAGNGGFTGAALYPQYAVSKDVTLGLRAEYFSAKKGSTTPGSFSGVIPGESVTAFTLTAAVKSGPLTFIPEVRLDNGSAAQFFDSKGVATKSAGQFSVAAVYAF